MSKEHFYFSRNDRIVAVVLLLMIVIFNLGRVSYLRHHNELIVVLQDSLIEVSNQKYVAVSKQTKKVEYNDTVRKSYTKPKNKTYTPKSDTTYYNREERKSYPTKRDTTIIDTLNRVRYTPKQRPTAKLDLNAIDSVSLITLPGIGPTIASRILRYRQTLGGFYSIAQLMEINNLPDSLMEWFVITDTVSFGRVSVNSASLATLRRHPYMNFYQARAIVELRKERGKIKGPEQLSFLEEFTAQDLERLIPYLSFE